MLRKALVSSNHQQGGGRWKIRICYIFGILIIVTVGLLLIAWNMLCGLPDSTPVLFSSTEESSTNGKKSQQQFSILNQLAKPKNADEGGIEDRHRHSIDVYYEVLCPDSRYFIVNDLIPAYNLHKDYIKPIFIPYGKASTTIKESQLSFDCQHGETECRGNMIHACAIAHLKDEEQLVKYIGCMITNNRNPDDIGRSCADKFSINWGEIHGCVNGHNGPELLKSYGDLTHSLKPPISFIPTIVVDGSQKGQREMLKNFKQYLCEKVLKAKERKGC